MRLAIYKPNSKVTGSAAAFQIGLKPDSDPMFFLNLIRQHSWDDKNKKGSFAESRKDPSKIINVKFGEFELGEILHTFNTGIPCNFFHTFNDTQVTIRIAPYEKTRGASAENKGFKYNCYGISITRNGTDKFSLPLEPGEYMRLAAFINNYFLLLDQTRKVLKEENRPQQNRPAEQAPSPAEANEMEF